MYNILSVNYVMINGKIRQYQIVNMLNMLSRNVINIVPHYRQVNFIICRTVGGNMFGPGRGRALSLLHILETRPSNEESADNISLATGGTLAPSSSVPDLRRSMDDDVEHGISLLVTGSPIDDSLAADDTLLDYDSDDGNSQQQIVVPSDPIPAAMDIESISMTDAAAGPSVRLPFLGYRRKAAVNCSAICSKTFLVISELAKVPRISS
jgi:hypothetical protein